MKVLIATLFAISQILLAKSFQLTDNEFENQYAAWAGKLSVEYVLLLGIPALIGCLGFFKGEFSKKLFNTSFWVLVGLRTFALIGQIMMANQ
ncbi:MAG: hypothetical protein CMB80_29555 [Flammeovirgaceae bacterium]|nr:hypothetical protein [Flammeovirgaceae bacterium]MBE62310.1 hypothetical protein [Flammeovirgaceae bacterium]HCX20333.1 hypothetical protein [Cytophagales bacterium]|tara:strand:+ start:1749 stop:2024 length:276 start_codon:yes stop_codon:yes gene_type:complete